MRYGFADRLGYGYCLECRPTDRPTDAYTPEADEACERCKRPIAEHGDRAVSEGIAERTPCRIF